MKFKILLFFSIVIFVNCNSINSDKEKSKLSEETVLQKTVYEKMEVAFVGNPKKSEIKSLLDRIIKFHGAELNDSNRERSASVLIALRKSSKKGLTEMDILRQMELDATRQMSFPNQAAISFTILESK